MNLHHITLDQTANANYTDNTDVNNMGALDEDEVDEIRVEYVMHNTIKYLTYPYVYVFIWYYLKMLYDLARLQAFKNNMTKKTSAMYNVVNKFNVSVSLIFYLFDSCRSHSR